MGKLGINKPVRQQSKLKINFNINSHKINTPTPKTQSEGLFIYGFKKLESKSHSCQEVYPCLREYKVFGDFTSV